MNTFDVLKRNLSLQASHVIEASAGTGKTFTIQHLFSRLLIESHAPLSIEEIVVLTFTRNATTDLKNRIRANLKESMAILEHFIVKNVILTNTPDYLVAILEKGLEAASQAQKKLEQAFFHFDKAHIFTIHGFCAKLLKEHSFEGDLALNHEPEKEGLSSAELLEVIYDFFRLCIKENFCSPGQLAIYLKEDRFQKKLLNLLRSGYECTSPTPFITSYYSFLEVMGCLKEKFKLEPAKLLEDFQLQANYYKNHSSSLTKAMVFYKIQRFAALFEKTKWSLEDFDLFMQDGVIWSQALDAFLLKKNVPSLSLHYPSFTEQLNQSLTPLIEKERSFSFLLNRFGDACLAFLKKHQKEVESVSPDELLQKMHQAIQSHLHFVHAIQNRFRGVIVDEFQDTNLIQWEIFQQLFLPNSGWKGFIYLVGDPKQAIYSFRHADVYTYFSAVQELGTASLFSLNVNYRSHPYLIAALNTLFDAKYLPQFISLPKSQKDLTYQSVLPSPFIATDSFQYEKGAIHFCIADLENKERSLSLLEESVFFPFILQEIQKHQIRQKRSLKEFAILVRDRHQGKRLARFLSEFQVPCYFQRGVVLNQTMAFSALKDLMRAVCEYRNFQIVKIALATPVLSWTYEELQNERYVEEASMRFHQLYVVLMEKGFNCFFHQFLESTLSLTEQKSVLENLLGRENGLEIYHDLQQIADLIVDAQYDSWQEPIEILDFLKKLTLKEDDEAAFFKREENGREGISILTLHASKGLEFDIVFAIGLVNRKKRKEDLIPIYENQRKPQLTHCERLSQAYQNYCEELDAEKMRELYVAMTRAKFQLYIFIDGSLSPKIEFGEASAIELFVARLGQPPFQNYCELYKRIERGLKESLIQFLEKIGRAHYITYSLHTESFKGGDSFCLNQKKEIAISPPIAFTPNFSQMYINSFSKLKTNFFSEREVTSPQDFEACTKNPHTLPANAQTGIFLHSILEKVSFENLKTIQKESELLSLISPYILKSFKSWEGVIASMVFHTVKTPLILKSTTLRLCDLEHDSLYREAEFLFPIEKESELKLSKENRFMQGAIDLVFFYNGLYYILDFKSHWLGPSYAFYTAPVLKTFLEKEGYLLQGKIYRESLKQYLRLCDPRPFETIFGGIIFLFLRGIQLGQTIGYYHLSDF